MPCSGMKSCGAALPGATTGCVLTRSLLRIGCSPEGFPVRPLRSSAIRCVWVRECTVMDDVDRQIVALLREDARRSYQSIGARVSLSAPAVKRRVDRLESAGVIRGYSAQVDAGRFGWETHAFVALYCEGRMAAAEVRAAV